MKKRIVGMLLAVVMVVTAFAFSLSAMASETTKILVIGDSISTGYGLASVSTESFASLLVSEGGFSVNNKAVDGNTAVGIAQQFSTNNITESDIASADIVTITCGGNDLMALFYSKIAQVWNQRNPDDQITASDVPLEMINSQSARRMGLMSIALSLLNSSSELYFIDDEDFTESVAQYIQTLNGIVDYIHSKNSDAKVIVATQYNPYVEFENVTFAGFIKLDPLYSGMEAGTVALNEAIVSNAENGGYYVADVKNAFDSYNGEGDLYNASPDSANMNVDFHPTAEGHRVIAETFMSVIEEVNVSDNISDSDTPQTGDNGYTWLWIALMVLSAGAACGVAFSNPLRRA